MMCGGMRGLRLRSGRRSCAPSVLRRWVMVAGAAAVSRLTKKHRTPGFRRKLRKPGRLFKTREAYSWEAGLVREEGVARKIRLRGLCPGLVSCVRREYLKRGLRVLRRFKVRVGWVASDFLGVSGVIQLGLEKSQSNDRRFPARNRQSWNATARCVPCP
jgi:hypothetical protein